MGHGHLSAGDYSSALQNYRMALQNARDPFYLQWPKFFIGMCYTLGNQFSESEKALREVLAYSNSFGCEALGTGARAFLAVNNIAQGDITRGFKILEELTLKAVESRRLWANAILAHIQGALYLRLCQRKDPIRISVLLRNFGFLIRAVPGSAKKAEFHLNNAIAIAGRIGAENIVAQAFLDLGRLYRLQKKHPQARKCVSEAIGIFEKYDATVYLQQARDEEKNLI
jgi:tetratricopeptide (TPR) repeat protein